jgi:hypothetical protein
MTDEKKLRHEMHHDINELREEVRKLRADIAELNGKTPR